MISFWYSVLQKIDPSLRKRLVTVIEEKYEYFILKGTDPGDPGGCCPSNEVASAMLLVEAGILEAREVEKRSGACPSCIYAFTGEITGDNGALQFRYNRIVRDRVYNNLAGGRYKGIGKFRTTAVFLLFVFLAASVGFAFYRGFIPVYKKSTDPLSPRDLGIYRDHVTGSEEDLPSRDYHLSDKKPSVPEQFTLLVLFHYRNRCDFCLTMETLSRRTLAESFPGEMKQGRVVFTHLAMDIPENVWLKEKFGLFTATLVLISFDGEKAVTWKILDKAWNLTNHPDEFSGMVQKEVDEFLHNPGERLP